jgi:hypothetical protein
MLSFNSTHVPKLEHSCGQSFLTKLCLRFLKQTNKPVFTIIRANIRIDHEGNSGTEGVVIGCTYRHSVLTKAYFIIIINYTEGIFHKQAY